MLPKPLSAPPLSSMTLLTPTRNSFTTLRAEGAGEVDHAVLGRRSVEAVIEQREGVESRIVLAALGDAGGEVILGIRLPVALGIALVAVETA